MPATVGVAAVLAASVPEVGRVTEVAPVVMNSIVLALVVVKFAAKVKFPAKSIVRSALAISMLRVRQRLQRLERTVNCTAKPGHFRPRYGQGYWARAKERPRQINCWFLVKKTRGTGERRAI